MGLRAPLRGVIFDYGNTLIGLRPPLRSDRTDYADVVARPGAERLVAFLERSGTLDGLVAAPELREHFLAVRETDRARANESGHEITLSESLEAALRSLGLPVPPDDVMRLAVAEFYLPEIEAVEALPGAAETLRCLKERGIRMALLSNATSGAYVAEAARRLGMRDRFDPFLVSADLGFRKPLERTFQAVLDSWKLPSPEVAMIGDSLYHDVAGAARLGLQTIHFVAIENPGDMALRGRVRPDATARSHAELQKILLSLFP